MNKYNNKYLKWIISELPLLKKEEIIDDKTQKRMSKYFSEKLTEFNSRKIILIIFSIVASLFIIGGIILLIAYNWSGFDQKLKTVLAFLLLMIPQGFALYYYLFYKKAIHIAVKEAISLVWTIVFGTAVATIGQIYHIPADTEMFLLIWAISTLFIIYFFNSLSSVAIYLYLIIALASVMQNNDKVGLLFVPLYLALIPHYLIIYKNDSKIRSNIYNYFLLIGITIGLGISLEKSVPGLWIVIYSCLFVVFYLIGHLFENKNNEDSLFYQPLKIAGILGIIVLAYMLSWEWAWKEIGWYHYRTEYKFIGLASIYDYILAIILPLSNVFLIIMLSKKKLKTNFIMLFFGLWILSLYVFNSYFEKDLFVTWLVNLFILLLCFNGFYLGYKTNSLLILNSSMIYLTLTIVSRFFDEDMSLFTRGLVFIACGIIILIVNVLFIKKLKFNKG